MSIFGESVGKTEIEDAVEATLRLWCLDYVAEMERKYDIPPDSFDPIRSYTRVNRWQKWGHEQIPACIIICPGMVEPPKRHGDGMFSGKWVVGVGFILSGRDQEEANLNAGRYTEAMRNALLQHPSLGGVADELLWQGEGYDDLPSDTHQTMAGGQNTFHVVVKGIADDNAGPRTPAEDPYEDPGDLPVVGEGQTSVTVEPKGN